MENNSVGGVEETSLGEVAYSPLSLDFEQTCANSQETDGDVEVVSASSGSNAAFKAESFPLHKGAPKDEDILIGISPQNICLSDSDSDVEEVGRVVRKSSQRCGSCENDDNDVVEILLSMKSGDYGSKIGVGPIQSSTNIPGGPLPPQKRETSHEVITISEDEDDGSNELSETSNRSPTSVRRTHPPVTCFNCDGNHKLRECSERVNHTRVKERRRELVKLMKDVHEQSIEKRYPEFKPGVISKKLREALGLKANQLPPYIYGMRKYGYPPGHWNKAVDVATSNIARHRLKVASTIPEPRIISRDMLPNYLGFTSPVPPGVTDDGASLGVEYDEQYSIPTLVTKWNTEELARCKMNQELPLNSNNNPLVFQGWLPLFNASGPAPITPASVIAEASTNTPQAASSLPWYEDILDNTEDSPYSHRSSQEPTESSQGWMINAMGEFKISPHVKGLSDYSGPRNYRITEELERREAEEKKRALEGQGQDANWLGIDIKKRPRSPSVLEQSRDTKKRRNIEEPNFITDAVKCEVDADDIEIIQETKLVKNVATGNHHATHKRMDVQEDWESPANSNVRLPSYQRKRQRLHVELTASTDNAADHEIIDLD